MASMLTDLLDELPPTTVHWLATRVFGVDLDALHHEWLDDTAGCCPCKRPAIPTPRTEAS